LRQFCEEINGRDPIGANGIQHFRQVPFDRRLEYRNTRPVSVYRRILRGADATHTHWVALQEDKCVGESFQALRKFCGERGLSLSRHGALGKPRRPFLPGVHVRRRVAR
jgi:hypothetical protein